MNRIELIEDLQKKLLRITFTKVDGTTRVMKCTLNKSLTEYTSPVSKAFKERAQNEEVIPVWDVENSAWRSFRLANVTKVENLGPIPPTPKHLQPGYKAPKFIEEDE